MSRQTKKRIKHLIPTDFDACLTGMTSNRIRKHLNRCGICARRARYLADDKARETIKRAQDTQGLAALALILSRIPPTPPRLNDGYVDYEDERKVTYRPWLSGAERDWLYQRLPTIGIITTLLLGLAFAKTRSHPDDKAAAFLALLLVGIMAGAYIVIQVIESSENDA